MIWNWEPASEDTARLRLILKGLGASPRQTFILSISIHVYLPFFAANDLASCGKHGVIIPNVVQDWGFVLSSDLQNRIENKNIQKPCLSDVKSGQSPHAVAKPNAQYAKWLIIVKGCSIHIHQWKHACMHTYIYILL